MAHEKRAGFVAELTASLDRAVPVVWDHHNDVWDTGRRALLSFDSGADYHLVLQDDVIACQDLLAGVERALDFVPGVGVVSLYTGSHSHANGRLDLIWERWRGQPYRWLRLSSMRWGPAVCVPTQLIDDLVAFADRRTENSYDQRIDHWANHRRLPTFYTSPSLVEHRRSPSLRAGRPDRHAYQFIGSDRSALDVDWSGLCADESTDPEGRPIVAQFRNISTGQVVDLKPGDSRFDRISRMTHRWERLDPAPEPEPDTASIDEPDLTSGTVDDVLDRVAGGSQSASATLYAELGKDEPRKTLVEALGQIVAAEEGVTA